MGIEVDLSGAERLTQTLRAAAGDLDDLTDPGRDAAALVLGAVKSPRRTGRLASTVAVTTSALGFDVTAGGPTAPYAAFVHARTPFLTDALDHESADAIQQYADYASTVLATIEGA